MIKRNLGPPIIYLPSRRRVQVDRPDVLLMQGFGTGGRAMEWIAGDLAGHGLRVAVPRSNGILGYLQTRRVHAAAAVVAKMLRQRPGPHRTWLVGHSIGGIIARHVVQMHGVEDGIAGVVTLGSPHRGTPAAILGLAVGLWSVSRAPFDVRPGASVIAELNRRPWPEHIPLVSVFSRSDMLCVHPAAIVPFKDHPAVEIIELPGLGHTELLWHRGARAAVVSTVLGRSDRR